jgi:putative oxidoreductase
LAATDGEIRCVVTYKQQFSTVLKELSDMWLRLLNTSRDYTFAVARVVLAIVILPHGLKMLGLLGGKGIMTTLVGFQQEHGIPLVLGALVIFIETFGCVMLIGGLLGRLLGLGMFVVMAVAALVTYHQYGRFMMNWGSNLKGEGIEFHLLAMMIALIVVVHGAGALSVDRVLAAHSFGRAERPPFPSSPTVLENVAN